MQSKGYYAVQGHSRVTISAALPLKTVPRASRSRLTTRNAPSYQILAQSNNPRDRTSRPNFALFDLPPCKMSEVGECFNSILPL